MLVLTMLIEMPVRSVGRKNTFIHDILDLMLYFHTLHVHLFTENLLCKINPCVQYLTYISVCKHILFIHTP